MSGHEPTDVINLDSIARTAARESRSGHAGFWIALAAALLLMVGVLLITLYTYGQTQDLANQQSDAARAAQALQGQVLQLGAKPVTAAPTPVSAVAGAPGSPGATGASGRGIAATHIVSGDLYVVYTNGAATDVGHVVGNNGATGATGATGRGIISARVNPAGDLVVAYSDNTSIDVGHVVGTAGAAGTSGAAGQAGTDGVGVSSANITSDGLLVLTYTDGSTQTVGQVVGPTGATGPTGPAGPTGATGADGKPPVSWTFTYTGTLGNQETETCTRSNSDDANPTYSCS